MSNAKNRLAPLSCRIVNADYTKRGETMNDIRMPPEPKLPLVTGRDPRINTEKCRAVHSSRLADAGRASCAGLSGAKRVAAARVEPSPEVGRAGAADQVRLSGAVSDLRRYVEIVKSATRPDPRRLEELGRAVKTGAYQVDPDTLAADLDFLLDDLGD